MKAILFTNDGCGSCKTWKPIFKRLMEKYNIPSEEVDIYKSKEIKEKYGVTGIPYTVFLNNSGEEIGSILGNMVEEIADRDIKTYLETDGE